MVPELGQEAPDREAKGQEAPGLEAKGQEPLDFASVALLGVPEN